MRERTSQKPAVRRETDSAGNGGGGLIVGEGGDRGEKVVGVGEEVRGSGDLVEQPGGVEIGEIEVHDGVRVGLGGHEIERGEVD